MRTADFRSHLPMLGEGPQPPRRSNFADSISKGQRTGCCPRPEFPPRSSLAIGARTSLYRVGRPFGRHLGTLAATAPVCARGAAVTEPGGLPLLLTADEAATLLRTTRSGIYAMAERRQVAGIVRIGRRLLFRRDELLEWLGVNEKETKL